MSVLTGRRPLAAFVTAAAAAGLVATAGGSAAYAVNGPAVTDAALGFAVKVNVGDTVRACTGAMLNDWWLVTATSCFADGSGTAVTTGAPPVATTATIGRLDLTGTDGVLRTVDRIVPHPTRDLVVARLSQVVRGARTVPVATSAPVAGETLVAAGFGRTADTWVPNQLHTGQFTVSAVGDAVVDIAAVGDAAICKGDAGGPLLRSTASGYQLAGLHYRSDQGGCLAETQTSHNAVETRVDDLASWITANAVVRDSTELSLTDTRIALRHADGLTVVKDGGVSTTWTALLADAKQIIVADDRLGVLTNAGVAWVKEGATATAFVNEHADVKQLVVSGNRIGVLLNDGTAKVKEGGLSTTWTTEFTGVQQLEVTDNRIGVLTGDGVLRVKEGGLSTTWTVEHEGVKQFALHGTRIGVLAAADGSVRVKEGGLSALWSTLATSGIGSIAIRDDRIAMLTTDGIAKVNEGAVTAAFVTEYTGVRRLAISGNRVGVIIDNGATLVKQGGLSALWTEVW